ncbi:MAG: hypothetical protein PHC61_11680 [Chitinivibrionales bacterium]|nr:hypothetical protein [Chitinivibrionales bacterium]
MIRKKEIRQRMIQRALALHKKIYPCANRRKLQDCFTSEEDRIFFWFNTEDQTTHVLYEDL